MENRPLYSADIVEIIGTPPRWIMRAGSGWLLLLLLASLGLASVIRIADRQEAPVRISGTTQPYYLRHGSAGSPLVPSGQVVEPGQPLARDPANPAEYLRAPFKGRLHYESGTGAPYRAGDTVAVLVPLANAYRFSGRVVPGQLGALRRQPALQLQVPLDSRADSYLTLQGRLGYVRPVVANGSVAYSGQLDSASNALLTRHLAAITSLDGTVLVSSSHRTLLNRFFD